PLPPIWKRVNGLAAIIHLPGFSNRHGYTVRHRLHLVRPLATGLALSIHHRLAPPGSMGGQGYYRRPMASKRLGQPARCSGGDSLKASISLGDLVAPGAHAAAALFRVQARAAPRTIFWLGACIAGHDRNRSYRP